MKRLTTFAAFTLLLHCSAAASQSAESTLTATQILDRSIEAVGGFERFAAIRASRIERTLYFDPDDRTDSLRTIQHTTFPHTMQMEVHRPNGQGQLLQYHGHVITVGTTQDDLAPAEDGTRDWFRGFYWREWWVVYARYAWHGLSEVWLAAEPPVVENGVTYHVISIEPRDADPYRLFIDAATWRPAMRKFRGGDREVVDVYSDYRESNGVLFPMRIDSYIEGDLAEEIVYSDTSFTFDEQSLSIERRLDDILLASLDEKQIPGFVALVQQGGKNAAAQGLRPGKYRARSPDAARKRSAARQCFQDLCGRCSHAAS